MFLNNYCSKQKIENFSRNLSRAKLRDSKNIFLMFLLSFLILTFSFLLEIAPAKAEAISDWYIKDFQSEIIVNKDSSLDITEKITADCGNLPDKHGIFRTLPLISKTNDGQEFKTPIELVSITDFSGNPYNYSTSKSRKAIEWKIGDADKTVHGVNEYEIKYHVKNAIRSGNADFDELWWNLSGNLWQIDIDNFSAEIKLPSEINENNTQLWIYSGESGAKDDLYSTHKWKDLDTLLVESTETLSPGYGISASLTFPKNIVTPYKPTWFEKYGAILGYLFAPLFALILGFYFWKRYGDDPNIDKSITPEFDIPGNFSPGKLSAVLHNGIYDNKAFAASLVNLAVNKKISIKELEKKSTFRQADYEFTLKKESAYRPDVIEQKIFDEFFAGDSFTLKDLRKDTTSYLKFSNVSKTAKDHIISEGFLDKIAFRMLWIMLLIYFIVSGIIFFILFRATSDPSVIVGEVIGTIIIIFFAVLMPKRTQKGADLLWKVKGFELYMKTAEKYRQQFNEKENIFEKYLPYAIMFGLTKQWIKAVETIKGKEYFRTYHPVWFVGNFTSFDADSFASAMSSVSSSVGTSSGASGGGGAGGGGGGGGGGGW